MMTAIDIDILLDILVPSEAFMSYQPARWRMP
jgi:hypothetical protein